MPVHEILISAKDSESPAGVREGDVLGAHPHPWNWGRKEIEGYVVLLVEDSRSTEAINDLISKPVYKEENGDELATIREEQLSSRLHFIDEYLKNNGIENLKSDSAVEILVQKATAEANRKGYTVINGPTVVSKRRYKISFDDLKVIVPDIDLVKIRNQKYIYQPFKNAAQLVQKFDGMNDNHLLEEESVDVGLNKDEIIISQSAFNSLLKDKTSENVAITD